MRSAGRHPVRVRLCSNQSLPARRRAGPPDGSIRERSGEQAMVGRGKKGAAGDNQTGRRSERQRRGLCHSRTWESTRPSAPRVPGWPWYSHAQSRWNGQTYPLPADEPGDNVSAETVLHRIEECRLTQMCRRSAAVCEGRRSPIPSRPARWGGPVVPVVPDLRAAAPSGGTGKSRATGIFCHSPLWGGGNSRYPDLIKILRTVGWFAGSFPRGDGATGTSALGGARAS